MTFSIHYAGHRGMGCTDSPHARQLGKHLSRPAENTLGSFSQALSPPVSAAMIETDIIRTRDDRLVLTHSTDFSQHVAAENRPTKKSFIDQLNLDEVEQLKLLHGNSSIPTLQALLSLVSELRPGDDLVLNLELKDVQGTACPRRKPPLTALVLEEINRLAFPLHRIRFSSFSVEILSELVAQEPAARIGMLFAEHAASGTEPERLFVDNNEIYRQFRIAEIEAVHAQLPSLEALHPEIQTLSQETVAYAATHNLAIATWGWLEESPLKNSIFEKAAYNDVDLCSRKNVSLTFITDYVADMRALIDQKRAASPALSL